MHKIGFLGNKAEEHEKWVIPKKKYLVKYHKKKNKTSRQSPKFSTTHNYNTIIPSTVQVVNEDLYAP